MKSFSLNPIPFLYFEKRNKWSGIHPNDCRLKPLLKRIPIKLHAIKSYARFRMTCQIDNFLSVIYFPIYLINVTNTKNRPAREITTSPRLTESTQPLDNDVPPGQLSHSLRHRIPDKTTSTLPITKYSATRRRLRCSPNKPTSPDQSAIKRKKNPRNDLSLPRHHQTRPSEANPNEKA